jgi:Xaa-Pro dipeptidase
LSATIDPILQEHTRRIQLARRKMEEMSLDALLLFTGPNLFYFTGMPCGRSASRPFIYLLPRIGEPVLIVHAGRQYEARSFTVVQDIRTYLQLSLVPLEQILSALKDRNLLAGRIGVEMSAEMVLDLPLAEYQRICAALPGAELVDASPLLWSMRMIKSPHEVAQITAACEITSRAYALTFQAARAGMSEAQIEALMVRHMLELGGSAPWVLITSGTGNYDMVSKGGTPRKVEPGDMVWMDVGCSVNGYWSDFSRAGVVGSPSQNQLEGQRAVYEITQKGVSMVCPGVRVAEIGRVCNSAVANLELPVSSDVSGLAARIGHGLGLVVTELPSLNEQDPTVLQPGMVVTIEPGFATRYGTFHVEQNVLVTPDGPRVLSSPTWELTPIEVSK